MLGNFIHVSEGDLYSGTVSDFSGSDALIIRDQIRTEQYNLKHLNNPDFVGSVEDEDYVYFFFREDAVENMNCAKVSDWVGTDKWLVAVVHMAQDPIISAPAVVSY